MGFLAVAHVAPNSAASSDQLDSSWVSPNRQSTLRDTLALETRFGLFSSVEKLRRIAFREADIRGLVAAALSAGTHVPGARRNEDRRTRCERASFSSCTASELNRRLALSEVSPVDAGVFEGRLMAFH